MDNVGQQAEQIVQRRFGELYSELTNFLRAEVFDGPYKCDVDGEMICRFCGVEQGCPPAADRHDMTCLYWKLKEHFASNGVEI
jgi:hypothetical protein